jgi:hypothetical protein
MNGTRGGCPRRSSSPWELAWGLLFALDRCALLLGAAVVVVDLPTRTCTMTCTFLSIFLVNCPKIGKKLLDRSRYIRYNMHIQAGKYRKVSR